MTIEDIKEVTEVAKDKLKENGDVYSKHILAYISYLEKQIEKMKCCGNCGNDKCTSKYRGNSVYHRQENGYACAENEDWIPRKWELATDEDNSEVMTRDEEIERRR